MRENKRDHWEFMTMKYDLLHKPEKCMDLNDTKYVLSLVHQFVLNNGIADYAEKKINAVLKRENEIIVKAYKKSVSYGNSSIPDWLLDMLQSKGLR